jgi:hypothetical protein
MNFYKNLMFLVCISVSFINAADVKRSISLAFQDPGDAEPFVSLNISEESYLFEIRLALATLLEVPAECIALYADWTTDYRLDDLPFKISIGRSLMPLYAPALYLELNSLKPAEEMRGLAIVELEKKFYPRAYQWWQTQIGRVYVRVNRSGSAHMEVEA